METGRLPTGLRYYYNPIGRHLRELHPGRPVAVAPSFSMIIEDINPRDIATSYVDMFAWQDAVGAGLTLDGQRSFDHDRAIKRLDTYYSKINDLFDINKERIQFFNHLGTDLELWRLHGRDRSRFYPAPGPEVSRQIKIESKHASFISIYDATTCLEGPGSNNPAIQNQRDQDNWRDMARHLYDELNAKAAYYRNQGLF